MPDKVLSDEFMTEIGLRHHNQNPKGKTGQNPSRHPAKKHSSSNQAFDCDISGFNNPLE